MVAVREERRDRDPEERPDERGRDHDGNQRRRAPAPHTDEAAGEEAGARGTRGRRARARTSPMTGLPRSTTPSRGLSTRSGRRRRRPGDSRPFQPRQREGAVESRAEPDRSTRDRRYPDRGEPSHGSRLLRYPQSPGWRRAQRRELSPRRVRERGSQGRVYVAIEATKGRSAGEGVPSVDANGALHIVYPSLIADPRRAGRLPLLVRPHARAKRLFLPPSPSSR